MLAKKVVASEEFQRILINQLNVSQSDVVKFNNEDFEQLFKNEFKKMNSENLNWINVSIYYVYSLPSQYNYNIPSVDYFENLVLQFIFVVYNIL